MPWLGLVVLVAGIGIMAVLQSPGALALGLLLSLVGACWAVLALAQARIRAHARDEVLTAAQIAALRPRFDPRAAAAPPQPTGAHRPDGG